MPTDLRLHLARLRLVHESERPVAEPSAEDARAEDLDRGESILILLEMTERYGLDTVHRWLRNFAAAQGKDVCR